LPSWAQPFSCVGPSRLFGPRGGVRMWHCQSVSVVCVPSLSVVQPLDCWSDPMALVALTLWGSGASRRRQSLPDDLHGCQSCPGDSEHGSGSVSRSRSTSASTRWSVFSFREALLAMSTRWSSTVRASSVRRRSRNALQGTPCTEDENLACSTKFGVPCDPQRPAQHRRSACCCEYRSRG
jgi:hypothetical protein